MYVIRLFFPDGGTDPDLLGSACHRYWASLSQAARSTGNLETWVVNRDDARIGDSLNAAVLSAPTSGLGALWWRLINASHVPEEGDVIQAVVEERTWLAIVGEQKGTSCCNP